MQPDATSTLQFPFLLELRHLEDRLDGLFFGGLNERTGVDDDDFGVVRGFRDRVSILFQQAQHDLGVDQVLGAAEAHEIDGRIFLGYCSLYYFNLGNFRIASGLSVVPAWTLR